MEAQRCVRGFGDNGYQVGMRGRKLDKEVLSYYIIYQVGWSYKMYIPSSEEHLISSNSLMVMFL